jgi:hypothetical protein
MKPFRIPNLADYKNEAVQIRGIFVAVLPWLADLLDVVDLSAWASIVTSVIALLAANNASTKVFSDGYVEEAMSHV